MERNFVCFSINWNQEKGLINMYKIEFWINNKRFCQTAPSLKQALVQSGFDPETTFPEKVFKTPIALT